MRALQKPITFKGAISAISTGGFIKAPSVTSRYGEVLNRNGQHLAVITEHTHHEVIMTLLGCLVHGHNLADKNIRGIVWHYTTINGDFAELAQKLTNDDLVWKRERAKILQEVTA